MIVCAIHRFLPFLSIAVFYRAEISEKIVQFRIFSLVRRLPLFFYPVDRNFAIPGIDLDTDPLPAIA